jgi:putative transposase
VHVVQRGHDRRACFHGDSDYRVYLRCFAEALHQTETRLHAYVLMTNHVHLLMSAPHVDAVSHIFSHMGRYVQYINRRYGRTGTLWESRYKCSFVQTEFYLLNCQRYIEMNPVRAGMVREPGHYPWSSFHANALGRADPLISPHEVYTALGFEPDTRQAIYRAMFHSPLPEQCLGEIRDALDRNHPLGDAQFKARAEQATGRSFAIKRAGRPPQRASSAMTRPTLLPDPG